MGWGEEVPRSALPSSWVLLALILFYTRPLLMPSQMPLSSSAWTAVASSIPLVSSLASIRPLLFSVPWVIHLIRCCGSSSQNLPVAAQLGKIWILTAPCDRHLPGILPPSFPTTVLQLHQPSCSFLNMLSSFPPQDLCTCCSFSFDCSSSTFLQDCFPHFIQVFVRCHLFRKDVCDDFIYLCTNQWWWRKCSSVCIISWRTVITEMF